MSAQTDRPATVLLWMGLLVVIVVRFAEPIQDGDPFWHIAYARQMLARGTLVVDHTAFSWTPTSNRTIYCAWAAELWLRWLWERLGPWSFFALRYAFVSGAVALAASYARLAGVRTTVLTPALLVLFVLMSAVGTLIKPELFSFFFFNVVLWIYFRAKLARLAGRNPVAPFYLVPAIVAVWVNHHGGFVLIVPFLLATMAGETLNARMSPTFAFSRRSLAHMLAGWTLCAVAVILTPYGLRYPVQLFQDYVLGLTPRPDIAWNAAHRAVFDRAALGLHLAEYFVILGSFFTALVVSVARKGRPGGRVDWAVLLVNLFYLALYLPQLRTTYLWPAVATYSGFYLIAVFRGTLLTRPDATTKSMPHFPGGRALQGVAIGLAFFISGRAAYEARYHPFDKSWLGFGVSDVSPVAEAEFLAAARLGPQLYNIFDSGGYLLWRLDPAYKVMTDSRSFPYLAWFDDQYRFTRGESFEEFLRKYPADVAVIDLAKDACVRNFLNAADWRLVYYGPTAAVFTKTTVAVPSQAAAVVPDRFRNLRNPDTARRVFDFATLVGDFPTAWGVLGQLETRHRWSLDLPVLRSVLAYRDAHRALRAGDFARARQLFGVGLRGPAISARDAQILELLRKLDAPSADRAAAAAIGRQLRSLAAPE